LTVGISCTNLLSIYVDYQLHLVFVFAATMLMENKDYQWLYLQTRGLYVDSI